MQNHQTQRLHRDGTVIDVSLTLSPLRDPDGALMGTAAIIRDITQQKREERRTAFIADAVQILDGSLDFDVVVRNLALLVVPRLADWCAIHVPEPDGSIRLAGDPAQRLGARATCLAIRELPTKYRT